MNESKIFTLNLNQLEEFAQSLALGLKVSDVVCLTGNLGVGKTTFAGFLINALIKERYNITSPTFNLLNQYKTDKFTIWHFDLYRIKSIDELYELGIEDALNYGVSIIEWPEIASSIIKENHCIDINIDFADHQDERVLKVKHD